MIAEGQHFIADRLVDDRCFPGLAIVLLAIGFSLLADGFADFLDPRDERDGSARRSPISRWTS